jgi:phthiocerol/phenolphthiocerol synthesis type-I polyketide synthase E
VSSVPPPLPADAIAVVGMAGRFAAAADVDELWQAVRDGRELITYYDRDDLVARGVPAEMVDHRDYVASRGALPDPLGFDAQFFGYSAREAELMDPQQRLLLETAWHTAEDAGLRPSAIPGRVGVFAATAPPTYTAAFPPPFGIDPMEVQLGNDTDFAAARISYKLGLDGPSIGVSTACSSGLTAVHLACQSLMNGDADTAFALAASVRLPADRGLLRAPGSILSGDGHCRPFAADADGTVEADGSAGVLLRRLDDALADGDRVYAVIVGSAIGNDGSDRVGFTAPGVEGQRRIIEAALRYADVRAVDVAYVEAHGTGTRLGDPVETRALAAVYGTADRAEPCRFGSLKSNLGHLNHAAGIAGLIKVVLSLKHCELAPSLHLGNGLNPELDLAGGRLRVQSHLEPWPATYPRRIAAVSSFGMGGSGAHVVVTAAPATQVPSHPSPGALEVLPLSARSPEALAAATADLAVWLARHPDADLRDVGHTLREGRTALPYRTVVVGRDHEEVIAALASARVPHQPVAGGDGTVLIFPGQGAEQPGMAATLYHSEPAFRRYLDNALDCLPADDRATLRMYLLDAEGGGSGTALAQPALFATEYAKAQCWEAAGLEVTGMIGHSVGEFAAACLAGVLSFEDAMRLVAARGRLVATTGPGAMLAVRLSPEQLRDRLRDQDGWDLAAHNADVECVLSGEAAVLDTIAGKLRSDGVGTMPLHVPHAFHSHRLDPVLAEFSALVDRVERCPPSRPYVSCVTGTWITGDQAVSVDHWVRHLRGTVRFAEAVRAALSAGTSTFVQLGPGRMATSHVKRARANAVVFVGDDHLPRPGVAQAWACGATVSWPATGRRIALPGYPFQRRTYVLGPAAAATATNRPPSARLQLTERFHAEALGPVAERVRPSAPAPTHPVTTRHPRPPMATPYRRAGDKLQAAIVDLLEELLNTDGIGVDDDFSELGWNSLLATTLASRIAADRKLDVDPHTVFDASTAARLATAIATLDGEPDQAQP